ncbi:MAG TPA: radical SAM protein [Spirochaetota bacterium]|nr:radical SAM protein [Spirochaetota bacterium]
MNKKKIVFVEPTGANHNVFAKYMNIPLLGPVYLATIVANAGYNASILNENILKRQIKPAELEDVDILCLSCMTVTINRGREIAAMYKQIRKNKNLPAKTIVGGIHASMLPEDVKDDFDQIFIGEAETKIVDLISGKITDKIIKGDALHNLDRIPVSNFKLIKKWEKIDIFPVMTSRGCPFNCTFCSVTEMFGKKYRVNSVAKILEDIKPYNGKHVFFVDDHFVINKKRTNRIMDIIEKHNLKLSWSAQIRTEVSKDEKLIARMKRTGCSTVYIGLESINPASLKEMKKGQSVADIKRAIRVIQKQKIRIHGMFIFGSDSDHKDIFKLTTDFCRKMHLCSVQYMILTPLPGTVLYRQLVKENRLLHKNWNFYDAAHVVFKPKHFTALELQQGMIDSFNAFYSYTNALNDALNIMGDIPVTMVRKLFSRAYFPSPLSVSIKLFGKKIVKNWVKTNKPYLTYLEEIFTEKLNPLKHTL